MNLMALITDFNAAEVSMSYAPFYVVFEKIIIGIILIFPALLLLRSILSLKKEG